MAQTYTFTNVINPADPAFNQLSTTDLGVGQL
jgi:hypothetical protein